MFFVILFLCNVYFWWIMKKKMNVKRTRSNCDIHLVSTMTNCFYILHMMVAILYMYLISYTYITDICINFLLIYRRKSVNIVVVDMSMYTCMRYYNITSLRCSLDQMSLHLPICPCMCLTTVCHFVCLFMMKPFWRTTFLQHQSWRMAMLRAGEKSIKFYLQSRRWQIMLKWHSNSELTEI